VETQLEQELSGFQDNRDSIVTIGVFDGVHLGHKYLINQLKELARQQGYAALSSLSIDTLKKY
jgi:riboflavin kinase/FMN adenylyltransferase